MRDCEPDPALVAGGGSDPFFGAGSPPRRDTWPARGSILYERRHETAWSELLAFKTWLAFKWLCWFDDYLAIEPIMPRAGVPVSSWDRQSDGEGLSR